MRETDNALIRERDTYLCMSAEIIYMWIIEYFNINRTREYFKGHDEEVCVCVLCVESDLWGLPDGLKNRFIIIELFEWRLI